jgi:8-oxo-dGTP diphosphatase
MADYEKAGLLLLRKGRILLCRKRRSPSLLILPGGKFEPGETAIECLERELREELGEVAASGLEPVGVYSDRAAGDPGKTVRIELYRGDLAGTPVASSEIGELVWFGESDDWAQLAPSLANKILPDLIARGILDWSRNDAH